jgi:hypothetical protein
VKCGSSHWESAQQEASNTLLRSRQGIELIGTARLIRDFWKAHRSSAHLAPGDVPRSVIFRPRPEQSRRPFLPPNSGHSSASSQRPLCGIRKSSVPTRPAANRPGKIDRPRIARGLTDSKAQRRAPRYSCIGRWTMRVFLAQTILQGSRPMPLASNLAAVGANARGRNEAFPALRWVLADQCRSPQGCLPTMRVQLRGCSSAQRFRAHSRRYGSCGCRHALQVPAHDAPALACSSF